MVVVVPPGPMVLLAAAEERVVDLRRGHLQLLVLALAVQEPVELGQAAEREGVGDGRLRVFGQLLALVAGVVAVAGHQETRQEGAEDEGHHNAGDEEGVVDAVVGLVQLRRTPHTLETGRGSG